MKMKRHLLRKIGGISVITAISRIFGFLREIVITFFLGTSGMSDAFYLAFSIPNVFRRFTAEGSMLSALIPTFTIVNTREGKAAAHKYFVDFFWCFCSLLVIFACIFILGAPLFVSYFFAIGLQGDNLQLTILLTQIMFGYIVWISLAAFFQGILNYHSIFFPSAITPIFLNISIITAAFLFSFYKYSISLGLALGVVVGGILQCLFHVPFLIKEGYRFKVSFSTSNPYVKQTFRYMLPGLFSAGIYQINIVISNLMATTLYEGSLTSLFLSNRLVEFILGIFIVSVTSVFLPYISKLIVKEDYKNANEYFNFLLRCVSLITLPAIIGMMIVGEDILRLLFFRGQFNETSLMLTYQALIFTTPALFFIACNRIMINCYQAMYQFKKITFYAFVITLLNITIALLIKDIIGHRGIALSNTISQMVLTILLWVNIEKKIKYPSHNLINIVKQFICALIMGVGLYFLSKSEFLNIFPFILVLIIKISSGIGIYCVCCYIFRLKEIDDLWKAFRQKQLYK